MAKPFDPRKLLKQIANPLLREFFTRRGELSDVPWNDLTEHKIDPIYEAWQALPEPQNLAIQGILRDVNELADHRGIAAMAEQVSGRYPDRVDEFVALAGKADKAMWFYLNVPEAFSEVAMFARADALAAGRNWDKRNSLPRQTIIVDDAMKTRLAAALTGYYGPEQMRGRHCVIDHYARDNGSEYFFAYLDDYPDKHMVFEAQGQPILRSDRYAFDNVFVYDGNEGCMESYAPGGRKVREPLEAAFCQAVLGIEIDPASPLKPSYTLDHLLQSDLPLAIEPEDGIEEVRITRLRLVPPGSGGYIEIKADPRNHRNDIHRKVERWLKSEFIVPGSTRVVQATFSIRFIHDGQGRQQVLTFDVSAPHTCNLKSKPDELRVIGERCLRRWGVSHDQH